MILLSSSTNATNMLYLTIAKLSYYYLAFIVLKILSVVKFAFISDALRRKREKSLRWLRRLLNTRVNSVSIEVGLREVEQLLSACPRFLVCRLFTLDRHVILSVTSSVVTYLIITLQFGFSETPNSASSNCTLTHLQ
ncbi:uncharacterized protein [Panulirus ornatus]|uniref:uncharacterized protein n=1 Tax=Panulirus ornatus TaxID=150431 RepID=UPI003A86555B